MRLADLREIPACERCRKNWVLEKSGAVDNAPSCDDCLRSVIARPTQLLDACLENTSKLMEERDLLKAVYQAAWEYLTDHETPLDDFVKAVREGKRKLEELDAKGARKAPRR